MIRKLVFLVFLLCPMAAAVDVDVLTTTKMGEDFVRNNLVNIFVMRTRTFPNGDRIQVFVLPKNSIYTIVFARKYLNMSAQEYFDMFADADELPTIVDSQEELVFRVLNTRGSIGYAEAGIVTNLGNRVYIVH